jgi:hypothetical protein
MNMNMDIDIDKDMDMGIVPDRRCRIRLKVVLVRRWVTWVLGIWRGEGLGERVGKGEVSLQAT